MSRKLTYFLFAVLAAGSAMADAAPEEVIAARKGLMNNSDALIAELEAAPDKTDSVFTHATAVAAMMSAFPFLFPSETNFLSKGDETKTSADPSIWTDNADFIELAKKAQSAATTLADATDSATVVASATSLRTACEECHTRFLHYAPPTGPWEKQPAGK